MHHMIQNGNVTQVCVTFPSATATTDTERSSRHRPVNHGVAPDPTSGLAAAKTIENKGSERRAYSHQRQYGDQRL